MDKMFICNQKARQEIFNNKGISLIAVTIVMLLVATLALLVASLMSTGNISSLTDMQSQQAFYLAQAGMEWYMERLQNDSDWRTPPAVKTNQAFGPGTFSVTYANQARNAIDVIGTGKVTGWDGNAVQRIIRQHVARSGGVMTISLWQEVL